MSVESGLTLYFTVSQQQIAACECELPSFLKQVLTNMPVDAKKIEVENGFSMLSFETTVKSLCEHIAKSCPDNTFKAFAWIECGVDGYTIDLDFRYDNGVLTICKWEYSGCMRFDADHQECVECDCDITDLVKMGKPFLCENCGVSYAPYDYEFEDEDMYDEIEYFYSIDPPEVTEIKIK